MLKPYFETKLGKLYHGDCLEIIPQLEPIDLVLTDPPYGINADKNCGFDKKYWDGTYKKKERIINDDITLDFSFLFDIKCKTKIIFGANNFYKQLPHKGIWICWDKRLSKKLDKMLGSSFELAWVDREKGFYKMYRILHGGIINADSLKGNNEPRFHSSQKPVQLFLEILIDFSNNTDIILDPFLGSGTTAIACEHLNLRWVGIEISKKDCEITAKRIGGIDYMIEQVLKGKPKEGLLY